MPDTPQPAPVNAYRLSRPSCDADWQAYHTIRRLVDFEDAGEADADDDSAPGHYPLLLCCQGRPVGAIRIDLLEGGGAAFRLVAIDPACQGQGHGRILLREAESFARDVGCRQAVVWSTQEAAGFYAAAGYAEDTWDEQYFAGVVMMTKPLHYAGFVLPELEADELTAPAGDPTHARTAD